MKIAPPYDGLAFVNLILVKVASPPCITKILSELEPPSITTFPSPAMSIGLFSSSTMLLSAYVPSRIIILPGPAFASSTALAIVLTAVALD